MKNSKIAAVDAFTDPAFTEEIIASVNADIARQAPEGEDTIDAERSFAPQRRTFYQIGDCLPPKTIVNVTSAALPVTNEIGRFQII